MELGQNFFSSLNWLRVIRLVEFIRGRRPTTVLAHCIRGKNRSPAIIAMLRMLLGGVSWAHAAPWQSLVWGWSHAPETYPWHIPQNIPLKHLPETQPLRQTRRGGMMVLRNIHIAWSQNLVSRIWWILLDIPSYFYLYHGQQKNLYVRTWHPGFDLIGFIIQWKSFAADYEPFVICGNTLFFCGLNSSCSTFCCQLVGSTPLLSHGYVWFILLFWSVILR